MTSVDLQTAIAHLYPGAPSPSGYTITVDSAGNATIASWTPDLAGGPEPTATELAAALTAAQLMQAQRQQEQVLAQAYQAARYGAPITITTAAGVTLTFDTTTTTQMAVMGYLVAFNAANWPSAGVPLQDLAGAIHLLTLADMQSVAVATANQSIAAWTKLQTLLASVQAATSVAAVTSVVW